LPKCLGGDNNKENLVLLTAREHFIAHKLLASIYNDNYKICFAFIQMAFQKNHNNFVSSRDYENAIKLFRSFPMPEDQKLKISKKLKGRIILEDQRKLISKRHKGKKVSKESIKRRMEKMKNYKHSEETRKKTSQSLKGRSKLPMSEDHKQKLRLSNLGKKQSNETIEKRRIKLIGHPNWYHGKNTLNNNEKYEG
jgi:hypothetical protein